MDHVYKTSLWSDACSYTSQDFKGQKDERAMDRLPSPNRNPEKGQTIHKDEEDQKATRYKKVQTMHRGRPKTRKTGLLLIH